tara:strand:- start:327 stop:800 length:474 start_codon:yes stop_codon:yes gene_type:complete
LNFFLNIPEPVNWTINNNLHIDLKWNEKQITDHFNNSHSLNMFCGDEKSFIGTILSLEIFSDNNNKEFEILHLGIVKNHRHKGIAFKLMQFFEKKIYLEKKNTTIFLEVNSHNEIAIKLYKKLGYKFYSERKNYYKNKTDINLIGESAILFKKIINE